MDTAQRTAPLKGDRRSQATADCYVKTTEIKVAVKGRETDVLDALGIAWRDGRPHITCPYPDHGGANDWRWDAKKDKAFCTCTHGDSVFDVAMKIEGDDFETAKIRIAEILSRQDLIRRSGGRSNGRGYQAMDAASLLNTPKDCRDDRLPVAYLAFRLGVAEEAVPIPSTPMVGMTALGYYDPPLVGSKAKQKPAGEFPCAIFGTVAANGKSHAHRIYLTAAGAGKANLGAGPDGRPRDPKKSARIIGDDNIAGRSVIWGDPHCAPSIILTEGIETGAAVAFALAPEVASGTMAVAAAISATGIGAFQPYPATNSVTIAADRDEAEKPDGKPGSRRGEQAARAFGTKHHGKIKITIALPGTTGEKVDWLDVLLRAGTSAVRDGIFAADPVITSAMEVEADARRRDRETELRDLAAAYPLPQMDTLTLAYRHTAAGKVKVHKVIEGKDDPDTGEKQRIFVPIASPFGVSARLRHADQASAYGLRCVIQDMNGQSRDVDFDRAALARMGAAEIRAALFAAGLRTEGDGELVAVQCLKAADPAQEIIVVGRPGWQDVAGCLDPVFVSPSGTVIGAPDGLRLELAAADRMAQDVAQAGTFAGWKEAIRAALSVPRCPHWILGVVAGFVGPIAGLTGLDTCGINFSGMSTSGKSLGQKLAVSAFSTTDMRPRGGLFQSARTTDNAVEALAHRATGTVLALDDLAHISGKEIGKMIYTIAGGVGKKRMNADAGLRDSHAWTTFAVFSSESSLQEKVCGDGGEWLAGMAVRIVDIDVSGGNRAVESATLTLIAQIEQHFGHAGPAFIVGMIEQGLHRQGPALRDRVLKAARKIAGGDGADSALARAATPLALLMIAGELAKTFGLIPSDTPVEKAVAWGWDRFRQSSDATVLDPETRTINSIRGWIAERWDVTIKKVNAEGGINNRETVAWYDENAVYIPNERLREAAGNTLPQSQVASILNHREMLAKRTESDRLYVRFVPKVGRIHCYALRRCEFGRNEHAAEPPVIHAIHQGGRND